MAGNKQDAHVLERTTRQTIDRFNEAFNRHDADAVNALLTDDTVFEDTSPAPDGNSARDGCRAPGGGWPPSPSPD